MIAVSRASSDWLAQFQQCLSPQRPEPARFASPNSVAATYPTMQLRAFGRRKAGALPTLLVPPFAVHDAGFVDLMRGHSLVKTLCDANPGQVFG